MGNKNGETSVYKSGVRLNYCPTIIIYQFNKLWKLIKSYLNDENDTVNRMV